MLQSIQKNGTIKYNDFIITICENSTGKDDKRWDPINSADASHKEGQIQLKKRMIYVFSLGLLTAAVFHAGMKYDGTLLVQAQENTQEDILVGNPGQEWELSDSTSGDEISASESAEEEAPASESPGEKAYVGESAGKNFSESESAEKEVSVSEPPEERNPADESEENTSVRLESAEIVLQNGLELVPAAMLPYLTLEETAKVCLHYSDESEQVLTGESDDYGNSISLTYEDATQEDGSVSRTYFLKAEPAGSKDGAVMETSQTVVFQTHAGENLDDIKAQEKTKVGFSGEKDWLLVQSVPQVTGKYSMESFGRELEELYYLADGQEEAVKADGPFELEEGVTYTFLLKLAP